MTTWKYHKSGQYPSWDGIQGDDVVIVEKLAMRPYYEVQCPVNIKNAGRYPNLASAKRAAFMVELAQDKIGPLLAEDGYKQSYIDKTLPDTDIEDERMYTLY